MQQNILTVQNTFDVCLPDTKILVGAECKIVDYDLFATTESYDVLKGLWMGSRSVGLKIWSEIQSGEFDQYEGHCMRQVKIWCTLYHQHISPFYGLCRAYGPYSCLVLPWKGEGQAIQYLSEKPASSLIKVCLEAAYGLQYLHSLARPIVLGGLRRSGILISDEGKALLADFEISDFEGSSYDSYAARRGKWDRWLAPELAEEGPDGTPSRLTKACDIWSWAMMVLEVLSEKSPFFASESGTTEEQESLRQRIRDGERPTRDEYTHPALEDSLWLLLESCWQTEPKDRPDIDAVVATMKTISTSYQEPPPPLLPS
ncbi:hypothetical protein BOTBODRAFT_523330 [Botryobasidium botryosum FD-172 SS1]|uniref:Protein kinase domain-containing protein n=1 Tax=Botryobasidium botryosum (strain FD-172 SS1) TaxID=930990 RepID=A0A067M257_BOTB1|nr:hypothetical protein BOTBODRAFT_523330 [Botryobasidium botryosum FD-172 SS1]